MATRRRWFQYSLRSFLILLTASAVWLGVVVHRAREQREAVKAIEALGGYVVYDWQQKRAPRISNKGSGQIPSVEPDGPAWLRQIVGDDYFQDVLQVAFVKGPHSDEDSPPESDILKSIRHLKQLLKLNEIIVADKTSRATVEKLQAAQPKCKVITIGFFLNHDPARPLNLPFSKAPASVSFLQ